MIANRFCSVGLACAEMHLSNHRIERSIASSTLGPLVINDSTLIVKNLLLSSEFTGFWGFKWNYDIKKCKGPGLKGKGGRVTL